MPAEVAAKSRGAHGRHVPVAQARQLVRKAPVQGDSVRVADRQQPPAAGDGLHEGRGTIARTIARRPETYASGPDCSAFRRPARPNSSRRSADPIKRAARMIKPARSPGVTRKPSCWSWMVSGIALIRVPMRGNPAAASLLKHRTERLLPGRQVEHVGRFPNIGPLTRIRGDAAV